MKNEKSSHPSTVEEPQTDDESVSPNDHSTAKLSGKL